MSVVVIKTKTEAIDQYAEVRIMQCPSSCSGGRQIYYQDLLQEGIKAEFQPSSANLTQILDSLEERGCVIRKKVRTGKKTKVLIERTVWGKAYLNAYHSRLTPTMEE